MGASSSAMARPMPRDAPVISAMGREVMGKILRVRSDMLLQETFTSSAGGPDLAGWKTIQVPER
ncbi:hypothetical protein GCM10027403_08890 [Arthrobacter tecti]